MLPYSSYRPQGTKISNVQFGNSQFAKIINLDDQSFVTCQFRPSEYTFTRTISYGSETAIGKNMAPPTFQGGGPFQVTFNLTFDNYEELDVSRRDVRLTTQTLWKMTMIDPSKKETATNKGEPPLVEFRWGTLWTFKAIITQMTEQFVLFDPDGTPVRSKVTLQMRQAEEHGQYPGQNPTSGGHQGYAVHTVTQGETIDLIAFQEYGASDAWRHLAASNNLDDPTRLQAGQRLVLVPYES